MVGDKIVVILKDQALSVALSTLVNQTALAVETGHGTGMLRSFLMKKVVADIVIEGITAGEGNPMLVGMARGEATVTDIKTAIELIQLERSDLLQAQVRMVLHETVRMVSFVENTTVGRAHVAASLGGGKGIPFEEGDGWQWFVYNMSNGTLTTGGAFNLDAIYYGVWLN